VAAADERLGHECTVAEDGTAASDLFREVAPDVVITDWEMPGLDGTELTRRIRSQVEVPYPYVIVLTARARQDNALHTMEAGADDLVFKPLGREELERMLVGAARVTALNRRLQRDARQDALTGLGNRHRLAEDLEAMHARAERYGGEEFLVLLPEQTLETAARAAERLRGAVEGLEVAQPAGGVATISVGVAGPAENGERADALVARADAALYAAKAAGRNRVEVAGAPGAEAPIRVMVADDDEVVTMLLSTIAEREPSLELVGTAVDAEEAVHVAVMRRPQVVLLDVDMPRGGGTAAATAIRDRVPDARIVALPANDSQVAMLEMARAGAVGYIVKGAAPATIVDTIRSSAKY
jgi:PleD family two-component response regulator